ncbi:hypothetical protein V2595_14970 [Tenacibaculum maritimum]|uniref:hypothetical protein n=2 Tax=Tenacibaculum maritimum TaxID=107401 RepID=UPI0012E512CE|nr:hypothetical protein [Tenacibaculum maritimum]CAA0221580.1 conserved hypothetical protein [Tenacibaculum maritimum]
MKLFENSIFFFLNIVTLMLVSCSSKGQQVDLHKKNYEFINLTKRQNKLIIYKPCDANVERIIIRKDTLIITTHQDGVYKKAILKKERINESEFLITYNLTEDRPDTVRLKKEKQLWNIDGSLFVESKLKQNYKYIEQPCIECFSKEECDDFGKNDSVEQNDKVFVLNTDSYNKKNAVFSVDDEWYGTYYFENSKKKLEYIITINNELTLSVESRFHGYTDQLKAVKVRDTLGLYHHKNISGANYDDTRKYDFLKFYKGSDGKFYFEGNLPYLPKGSIQFDKVK